MGKIDIRIAYLENIESMIKGFLDLKNNPFDFDTGNVKILLGVSITRAIISGQLEKGQNNQNTVHIDRFGGKQ